MAQWVNPPLAKNQHPIPSMAVQVSATPLQTPLPASAPKKAVDDDPTDMQKGSQDGVHDSWLQLDCCGHLRSKSADGRPSFLSFCLSNK